MIRGRLHLYQPTFTLRYLGSSSSSVCGSHVRGMGDKSSDDMDEMCCLDGTDLAHVLTGMAAIKPLFERGGGMSSTSPYMSPDPQEIVLDADAGSSINSTVLDCPGESVDNPLRKRHHMKDEKVCGVCNDKALGYNFNAVTCESCKAFFRRNAHKPKPSCLFQGNCVVDVRTRRFCPACRIAKCFGIGMKADMILDDTEKKARMEKVVENRAKRQSGKDILETHVLEVRDSKVTSFLPAPLTVRHETELPSQQYGLPKQIQGCMFKHPPRELLPSDPQFYRRLNEEEKWILNDISTAYQGTIATLHFCESESAASKSQPTLNELINSTDETVRQLIRFVGKVSDFQSMCKEDRISCLKNSVMQSVLLRSACVYILEKDVFLSTKGEVPTIILQRVLNNTTLYSAHVNFCRSIKSIFLNNYTLWALAQILALFNPCGPVILERELLSSLQDKYIILLKHYLESEFSFTFAQDYLGAIQDMLRDLKAIGEAYTTVIYSINPTEIEPLLLEVFNLK